MDADAHDTSFCDITNPLYTKNGPVVVEKPQYPTQNRLDEAITLHGYSIEEAEISAGRPLQLQLFWLTSQPLSEKYKVFVHVIDIQDFHKVAQRDGEPACGRYDTDTWRVGDVIVDRYYLPTTTESRPGEYTVLVGMYDAETHDLLPVFDASENHIGDSIQLHTVTVDEP